MLKFEPFPKIARLKRDCVITEKIDGANAQIHIVPFEDIANTVGANPKHILANNGAGAYMLAGSRSRYLSHHDDNFGFANWAMAHAEELFGLGLGRHYGEWWGSGIQRRYGLANGEKRFSLFNTNRWRKGNQTLPACCRVVPVLFQGEFSSTVVDEQIQQLKQFGSEAMPGFMDPEGIVVFLPASSTLYKVTCEGDEKPKGKENPGPGKTLEEALVEVGA